MKKERSEIYNEIQYSPFNVGESDLVRFLDLSRLDPRLMEICTEFVRDFWYNLDPVILNKKAKASKYPFMVKAAIVMVWSYCSADDELKSKFSVWMNKAMVGIKDPAPQLLYIGVVPVGSKMASRAVTEAIPALLSHNLVENHIPFNKGMAKDLKTETWAKSKYGIDAMKASYAKHIKHLKVIKLSNEQIMKATGINRAFLSKIINNKLNGISLDYLIRSTEKLNIAL